MPAPLSARIREAQFGRVFVVYGSASFGALQGIELFSTRFGLPDWLFTGTLILAALALPVVVATALVRGGERARAGGNATAPARHGPPHAASDADSEGDADADAEGDADARTAGSADRAVADGWAAAPAAARGPTGWLTWRRSTAAIAAGFLLLLLSTAVFMGMRHLGIGPVGTLLAKGVLEQRDPLIVADFESADADSTLARVVSDAFRIDFSQSPSVTVVQPQQLQQTLQLMESPGDAAIDARLAMEIAQRRGVKAVVTGELTRAGSGFLLSARLVAADGGTVFIAHRESARDAESLIPAIDRLSRKLRERIGESLRTVRSEPLAHVTTASIDALRNYTQAVRLADFEADFDQAIALLNNAVRIDTAFSMAYRKLGIVLVNSGGSYNDAVAAFDNAYRHRSRLPDRERHLTEAAYHSYVVPNADRTVASYRAVLAIDPDEDTALNNLAIELLRKGELSESERLLERALAIDSSYQRFINLSAVRFRAGRTEEAAATLDAMRSTLGDGPRYEQQAALFAAARFDYDTALQHIERLAELGRSSPIWRLTANGMLVGIYTVRGQLNSAETIGIRAVREAASVSDEGRPLQLALGVATLARLRGDFADVRRRLDDAVRATRFDQLPPFEQPFLGFAITYAQAGHTERARDMLRRYDTEAPQTLRQAAAHGRAMAEIETLLAEERADDALRAIDDLAPGLGCFLCLEPMRARAHDIAGRTDQAIAAYEGFLAERDLARFNQDIAVLADVLENTARLYDDAGNAERARYYYARFAELWENADPELQPRVSRARDRIRALMQG